MPDLVAEALALPDAWLLGVAAFLAGLVRGFAGFGTALVFMPIAAQVISPVWAIVALVVMDLVGQLPAIPRALRDGHPRDLARLVTGTLIVLPLGFLVLFALPQEVFRYAVSILSLTMLAVLILGLRYRGEVGPKLVWATGGVAGFLGGTTGIPGPPVILLYMASPHPPKVIRANNTAFLYAYDWIALAMLAVAGAVAALPFVIGVLLILPNLLGNLLGGWIFRPDAERFYRAAGYAIIALAAITGLPLWE